MYVTHTLTVPTRRSGVLGDAAGGTRQSVFLRHYRALSYVPAVQRQGATVHEHLLHRAYETAGHSRHFVRTDVGTAGE